MAANERLSAERAHFKASLSTALKEDDDPLAAYDQFVKWTVKNYEDGDPSSGLRELLQEATAAFKSDPVYKTDLRYLKLWILYIRQLTRVDAVATFAFLLANGIGASYSILYEEYAAILELDGRHAEAKTVYQKGIKRQVRPLERLKSRYHEFKGRLAASTDPDTTPTQLAQRASVASPSSLVTNASLATTAESRYAHIFAPPLPGKRPEKPQFDLSLLFSDKEYCIEEARARSIGLYGKKWPAPPPPAPFSTLGNSAVSSSSSMSSVKVNFNDDGQGSSRMGAGRRRSMMGGAEPTVTINTKEALADVFGMFNSPEKTAKLAAIVQHKKIEPATPIAPPPRRPANENENSYAKTPQPGFRPFVDENAGANISRKENTPAKHFVPFVDPETIKTPFSAPRVALSQKETPTPVGNPRTNPSKITVNKLSVVPEDTNRPAVQERNVFKVFTPAIPADQPKPTPLPLRDVFTDDHGKPQPKPKHERAKSYHDSATPAPSFKPFVDENSGIRTPFKVFSRPPEEGENAVTPGNNPVFTPFKDAPKATPSAFTPYEDVEEEPKAPSPPPRTPSWSNTIVEIPDDDEEEELEQYADDFQYDDDDDNGVGEYLPLGQEQEVYEDTDDSYQVPLGGRFGQFNVMTPITERTFEFTSTTARSSTFGGTPSRVLGQVDEDAEASWHDEHHAAAAAERLVAELQEDDDEEEEPLQQQTSGAFRLVDTLNLTSNFKPPNPCNPFDHEVISALLARIVPDQFLYDLRDHDADMLDSLQKFAKRARKTSGNTSNNTGLLDGGWFPLNVGGHRFSVCEKLGEGGFGAVFKAKDLGTRQREDDDTDDEEDDDDEDGSSMVALKVVKPRNLWEYRVLRRLHSALPSHLRRSVVVPHALFAFRDESYLVMDLSPQGTLLNIVNGANSASLAQAGGTLDELLVMFFAVELLRVVEAMHSAGFIHGDLKIDNCLLRLEDVPGGPSAWSATYNPTGEDGWSYKGITLIDFGRTIDTRLFPSGQQFIADWDADARDCFELREQRPWTYQTDYFGLAGIIYCLLFGKYIQANSVSTRDGRHKIDTPLKRYWQTEIWDRLFGILLNPCSVREDGSLPLPDELAEVRGQMEAWLQAHCNRTSNTLKGLLKKVQMLCI